MPVRPSPESHEALVARMLAGVRASGLKLTRQREAIVHELAGDETHPTAQALFERLLVRLPGVSFATVYNTLDALSSAGLCAALSLAPGAARFDPNMGAHHHAVCDECGTVLDVPTRDGASERASAGGPPGFTVRAIERVYRGVCAACRARPARSARS